MSRLVSTLTTKRPFPSNYIKYGRSGVGTKWRGDCWAVIELCTNNHQEMLSDQETCQQGKKRKKEHARRTTGIENGKKHVELGLIMMC